MFWIVATGTFLLVCTIGASDISTTSSTGSSEDLIIPVETLESTIQPEIDTHKSPNVSASVGRTAMLKCTISNLGQKSVSWVRHNDVNLISVGKYKYIKDKRIRILHESHEWVLIITDVQFFDKGLYECQVNSSPRVSKIISLNVVQPYTEILGGSKDVFINLDSAVNLTCIIHSPEKPAHIFWSHNGKVNP
ncbi:unnamed protein product [Lepeophtheirus salmonis]|uniref:(salmon louse) hypothetical protein n=1 Tax=Lepeophtheirus salmonis TaxID=72036 RepID=A0A7R8H3I5_LEPSM|nr:unnamed protein product [Lepeophtheirus salmonis]CAF2846526.1 unnamed protein product [Lepeophtheirus salmonis]